MFASLWIFFGITALVICGLIFVIVRSSMTKKRSEGLGPQESGLRAGPGKGHRNQDQRGS